MVDFTQGLDSGGMDGLLLNYYGVSYGIMDYPWILWIIIPYDTP